MQWENPTSYDFETAVQTYKRVAILPIGVIESSFTVQMTDVN